ncbi:unnamed protein product [Haemonchus placei]|uniref:Secreted protein n=1 Tax=Haemonchus placei TaxID=6290 RepID=A0A0N4WPX7_HAEPC|nr:unnamed protein product [Haemonchus placei]
MKGFLPLVLAVDTPGDTAVSVCTDFSEVVLAVFSCPFVGVLVGPRLDDIVGGVLDGTRLDDTVGGVLVEARLEDIVGGVLDGTRLADTVGGVLAGTGLDDLMGVLEDDRFDNCCSEETALCDLCDSVVIVLPLEGRATILLVSLGFTFTGSDRLEPVLKIALMCELRLRIKRCDILLTLTVVLIHRQT